MVEETRELPRVVVVDSDRLIRELAADALRSRARVEGCASAEAALEALRREPADLVVSELELPGLTGIGLLERIRRQHPGTDFLLLSADPSPESAAGALRLGAADTLGKPLRAEPLAWAVERILSRRRLAAENARLRDTLAVVEACRSLSRCLDAGEVYAVALDLILHALERTRGVGLFRRNSPPVADGVAFRGFSEGEAQELRQRLVADKPFDFAALTRLGVTSEGPFFERLREAGVACDRALAVPLAGGETEVGVLWILEDGRAFRSAEIDRVALIAGHARIALHNAERYQHAKERAFIDDTTEVYNARYLHRAVEHEIQRAERYGRELSVLFLDLDHFKRVNDQFGHLVGSQTLRHLSEVLLPCVRQVDTLARYGGDEFTVLLVDTGHEAGLAVAERIRRLVADTRFEGGRDRPIRLTISIGVATWPAHGRTREAILDQADKAMYRAKSLGRDRVCSASEL